MDSPQPTDNSPSRISPSRRGRRLLRGAIWLLFSAAALGALVRIATLRGLATPLRVSGGSMAETFIGEHFALVCADCAMPFRCGADVRPTDGLAVCPNCGYAENAVDAQNVRPGERVLVDQISTFIGEPRRFDVVALQTDKEQQPWQMKRIVGLPGERIELRNGDLYADGRMVQKSLAQLREVAILVNDDNYRPSTSDESVNGSRWAPDRDDSDWRRSDDGFEFAPRGASNPSFDWLTYRHLRSFAGSRLRQADPVRDNYGYNQNVSRPLFEVSDLLLGCRIETTGDGVVALLIHDGRDRHEVQISPSKRQLVLRTNDTITASAASPASAASGQRRLEMAICDSQVFVAIDGQEVLRQGYEKSDRPFQPTSRPAAIGASGVRLRVANLRLMRDIFYLHPARTDWSWKIDQPLGPGQFLLLGDNAPISVDSRRWQPAGVDRKFLLGRVLRWDSHNH